MPENDDDDIRLLSKASFLGDIPKVRELLANGISPNGIPSEGWSPLHGAIENLELEIVNILLSVGADPDLRDNSHWTPLFHVVNVACDAASQADESLPDPQGLRVIASLLRSSANPNLLSQVPRGNRSYASYPAKLAREYAQEELAVLLDQAAAENTRSLLKRIKCRPNKKLFKYYVRDSQIPVANVLKVLSHGMSSVEILNEFPDLKLADIQACLAFASQYIDRIEVSEE